MEKLGEKDPQLQLGQASAEAEMLADAETQLRGLSASQVEAERITEDLLVAVR
jgi:hypothetical protein